MEDPVSHARSKIAPVGDKSDLLILSQSLEILFRSRLVFAGSERAVMCPSYYSASLKTWKSTGEEQIAPLNLFG